MTVTLHDYQEDGVDGITSFLQAASQGESRLYTSPTGSGKSYIEAEVRRRMGPDLHVVVPTLEIAQGITEKLTECGPLGNVDDTPASEARIRELTESVNVYTAKRYFNLLNRSEIRLPRYMLFDEAHHVTDDNQQNDLWCLAGRPPRVGLTATGYRGTPQETKALHDSWGTPEPLLTLKDAASRGVISVPTFAVWPLMNDDMIDVVNGEFVVKQTEGMVNKVLPDLLTRVAQWYNGSTWDRPTTIVCSSVASANEVGRQLANAGLPNVVVVGESSFHHRQDAFRAVVAREVVLVQVRVVGEGVDLPLRRMLDLSPTMSPLLWMQRVGRVTRPCTDRRMCELCIGRGDIWPGSSAWSPTMKEVNSHYPCPSCNKLGTHPYPPEYITTCHNLTRHSYLWAGVIPASQIRSARSVWGDQWKPKRRHLTRAIGLEGLGKFVVSEIPLVDGLTVLFYGVQSGDDRYAVAVHPCIPEPLFFHRQDGYTGRMIQLRRGGSSFEVRERSYGKWKRVVGIPDLSGFTSLTPDPISPAMEAWWTRSAKFYGLDPAADVNAREFQLLPALADSGIRFKPQK